VELDGTTVDCPGCKQPTVLSVASPEAAAEGLTPVEVVAAFPRPVPKTPVPFLYKFGLVWVTLAMLLLPLVYLALIAAAAYGVSDSFCPAAAIRALEDRGAR